MVYIKNLISISLMETFQYNTWIWPDRKQDPARSRPDSVILDPTGSGSRPDPQNPLLAKLLARKTPLSSESSPLQFLALA